MTFSDLYEGLPSNLLAEVLGILVTVLIVERVVRHVDRRRWEGARDLQELRLYDFCRSLLLKLLEVIAEGRRGAPLDIGSLTRSSFIGQLRTFARDGHTLPRGMCRRMYTDLHRILGGVSLVEDSECLASLMKLERLFAQLADPDSRTPPDSYEPSKEQALVLVGVHATVAYLRFSDKYAGSDVIKLILRVERFDGDNDHRLLHLRLADVTEPGQEGPNKRSQRTANPPSGSAAAEP